MQQYDELISVSGRFPSYNTLHVIAPLESEGQHSGQMLPEMKRETEREIRDVIYSTVGG